MRRLLVLALVLGAAALLATVAVAFVRAQVYDVRGLAKRIPEETALMRQRGAEARRRGRPVRVERRWVPYARISPLLRRAILVAEDDRFFSHDGLDWNELAASARKDLEERRVARGGSTITQQLAKNVYLGAQRTPLRKLTEMFLAMRMERELSKRRIFELYLNLIEWGDGIYGAQAAARHWFGTSASDLSPRQAVLLAAIVINPRRYSPLDPPRRIERRARMIASRLRRRGVLDEAQYDAAIGKPPPGPGAPDTLAAAPDSAWAPGPSTEPGTEPAAEPGAGPPADPPPGEPPAEPEPDSLPGERLLHQP